MSHRQSAKNFFVKANIPLPLIQIREKDRKSEASDGFRAKAVSGQAIRLFASFSVLFSFKNCGKWCEEHGLKLTGHVMREPSLRTQTPAVREDMDERFQDLTKRLLFNGIDFDFISESHLTELCSNGGSPLRFDEMDYDAVPVPGSGRYFDFYRRNAHA